MARTKFTMALTYGQHPLKRFAGLGLVKSCPGLGELVRQRRLWGPRPYGAQVIER